MIEEKLFIVLYGHVFMLDNFYLKMFENYKYSYLYTQKNKFFFFDKFTKLNFRKWSKSGCFK